MRKQALTWFGFDSVAAFLTRLWQLGFIVLPEARPTIGWELGPTLFELPNSLVQHSLEHAAVPWYCLWEINTLCNLRCSGCYQQQFQNPGVDSETALEFARHIVNSGALHVSLFGGEALLRPDLERLITYLRQSHMYVKLITNGVTLTAERAERLRGCDLNHLEVSLDSLHAESHDRSRGPGQFAAALAGLENARRASIPRRGIVLTVHSDNLHQLPDLPAFLRRQALAECYLSPFRKTGELGAHASWDPPSSDDAQRIGELIATWRETEPDLTVVWLPACTCGRTSIVVGADADVRPCPFSSWALGSLHRNSLRQIWSELKDSIPESGPFGYCQAPDSAAQPSLLRKSSSARLA